MTFLAPGLAIAGLLAASIPIIIHLLLRRRRKPIEWAAMTLLMEAARRHRRRSRVERILLLAIRVVLLALLGAALARPLLGEKITVLDSRVVHLVIDDGITSGARSGDGTALEASISEAITVVEGLDPSDRVSVVLAGRPVRMLVDDPTSDHRSVIRAIEGLAPREGRTDFASALEMFVEPMRDGVEGRRNEVRILSEMRQGSIDENTRPPDLRGPGIRLISPEPVGNDISSIQVMDIESSRVPLSVAGSVDDRIIRISLRRTGSTPELVSTVRVDGDAIATPELRKVEWPSGVRDMTVEFQVRVDDDGGIVTASIDETDDLSLDDQRSIVVQGRVPSRMLVLERDEFGGSGRVDRWRASDWFERAMLPDVEGTLGDAIEIDRVDPSTANLRDLDGVSIVLIGRPDLVSDDFLSTIGKWVRDGGVLVTVPPGSTTVRPWASPLLGELGIDWSVALEAESLSEPRRLAAEQPPATLTRLLDAELGDLAPSVSIERRLPIEGAAESDIVLVDSAGEPVLLDVPVGLGRLVFFAVAPELSWTDLPVRPLMVPLVQEIARRGTALSMVGREGIVGERIPSSQVEGATMVLPGGDRIMVGDDDESNIVIPSRTGTVEIKDLADRVLELRVVNPEVENALLETATSDSVLEWLSPSGDWTIETEDEQVESAGLIGSDLAGPLILVVLFLLLLETVVARWFARGGLVSRRSRGLTGANADADAARVLRTGGAG